MFWNQPFKVPYGVVYFKMIALIIFLSIQQTIFLHLSGSGSQGPGISQLSKDIHLSQA